MLGLTVDPTSSAVRLSWPTAGAPFQSVQDDVCYIQCLLEDEPYDKIRDLTSAAATDPSAPYLVETWTYTRAWNIRWIFYGPNSLDNARALKSGLFQDYFADLLNAEQLFPVSEYQQAVRVPELLRENAQWIERVDFKCCMYEFVTETLNQQTVISVETILEGNKGVLADFIVETS